MPKMNLAINTGVALMAGCVGGAIGYFLFMWIARQGFYALALPGSLIGIGAGAVTGRRSVVLAAVCGFAALALGLFTEWRFEPFAADKSLGYFVGHIFSLQPITLLMVGVGVVVASYLGLGRNAPVSQIREEP